MTVFRISDINRLPLVHPSSDQGTIRDSSSVEDPPLTYYKLFNMTTAILWAVPKAIFSYKNSVLVPSTFDLLGVLCGVM